MSSERTPLMANGSAASTTSSGGGGLFGWMKQAPTRKESSWDKSKVDPKVFFGNERTFLAWVHVGVVLAGMSVALVAATENHPSVAGQIYGILLLPVAFVFIVYSMSQYSRRAVLIHRKAPSTFAEDTTGPLVLTIMLITTFTVQFAVKLYSSV